MKQLYTLTFALLVFSISSAQTTFWTEDFGTGCNQGQLADGFTGSNGIWSVTTSTVNNAANVWYVSSREDGLDAGNCGTACVANDHHCMLVALRLFTSTLQWLRQIMVLLIMLAV